MRLLLGLAFVASIAHADPPKPPVAPQPKPPSPYEGEGWKVKTDAPKGERLGDKSKLEVTVETRAGFHLDDDYPINFQVDASGVVAYDRARIDKAAATLAPCKGGEHACSAKVPVTFTAKMEGAQKVGGTFAFAVCDETHCMIEKVPVSVEVAVRP